MALTIKEALRRLWGSDHCILTEEAANEIADALGVHRGLVPAGEITDRRSDPKGARLYGVKEGEKARGVCAAALAESCCRALNLTVPDKQGVGSRLREATSALYAHFKTRGILG